MTPRPYSGVTLSVSLLALGSTLACGGLGEGPPAAVRDSAGVRIVEHREGALELVPRWTLAAEPELDIGVADGPEEYQLYLVTGARVLRNGEIVVVNTGSHELRFYDSAGTYLRALGREGKGPGEFGAPWGMWDLAGDTLAVWDFTLRRLSLFADGDFVESSRLERDIFGAVPLGVLADEQLLLNLLDARVPDVGFEMFEQVVFAFTLDGTFVDTLGRYPARLVGRYGETGLAGSPLFDAEAVLAAGDSAYWVGTGRTHEVTRYDATGAPQLVVRWAGEPMPVPPELVEEYNEHELEGRTNENARRRTRRLQEARPTAEYLPVYDSLVVDRNAALWMRWFALPWAADAEWVVFGADGIAAGRLTAPRSFQPLDIGDDYILGATKDELDVEHVRLYDLIKPEP
jgi:hypothetical protein